MPLYKSGRRRRDFRNLEAEFVVVCKQSCISRRRRRDFRNLEAVVTPGSLDKASLGADDAISEILRRVLRRSGVSSLDERKCSSDIF